MKTLAITFVQQKTETECGLAILQMILGYKNPRTQASLLAGQVTGAVHRAPNVNPLDGVSPDSMEQLLHLLPTPVTAVRSTYPHAHLLFANIKRAIDADNPIIAYIQNGLQGLYGHYLLIIGYGLDPQASNREFIELHDPEVGANRKVYYDNFPAKYYTAGDWFWVESWVLS